MEILEQIVLGIMFSIVVIIALSIMWFIICSLFGLSCNKQEQTKDNKEMFDNHPSGVYKSIDGGLTWTKIEFNKNNKK